MAPVLSPHITVSLRTGSGQASRLQNKKKQPTILLRVYINRHKILINVTVVSFCLHLCFTCLLQKRLSVPR